MIEKRVSGDSYWLADSDPEVVVCHLDGMHQDRLNGWAQNPLSQAWIRNIIAYYSPILEADDWGTALSFQGEKGELIKMSVPEARLAIRQLVALITKQKLAFNALAQASNGRVTETVRLANALMDQIIEKEGLHAKGAIMAESALVTGQGIMGALWRTDLGLPVMPKEDGSMIYQGGLEIMNVDIFDCFFDYRVSDWKKLPWLKIRTPKNRWDLIALFPDMKDKLLSIPKITEGETRGWDKSNYHCSDMIWVNELYARPTPALPEGRMTFYCSHDTIFHDGQNMYGTIPFEMMRPQPIMRMLFGYAKLSDLLPAQEMYDHGISAIATNQSALAVQSIAYPRQANLSVTDIQGMNWFAYDPVPNAEGGGLPKPIQLTQSSPETFKFNEFLSSRVDVLSGLNGALKGNPPPGVTSGTAIATLSTNALEFISTEQQSYVSTMEKIAEHALNAYHKFTRSPMSITMKSKKGQSVDKTFTGDDLEGFAAVKITAANPLMQTMAGRMEMATKLGELGLIKNMQAYFRILEGEETRELYDTELSEEDLMQMENDMLQEGKVPVCLITDDHPAHIREHHTLLNDPTVRQDPAYVQAIMDHIIEHDRLARDQDPFLTAMVRTGKMPEGGPPMPEGQGMGAPQPPNGEPIAPELAGPKPAEPAQDMLNREVA